MKRRYNDGLASNLYFWRDNTGEEVDVLIEHRDKLMPVQIKSGQSFTSDFLAGLHQWMRHAGDTALPARLVYGGDQNVVRGGVMVHSWKYLQESPSP